MKNGVYKWEWGFYGVQVSCIAWEVGLGKRQKEYKTKVLNDIRRKNTTHIGDMTSNIIHIYELFIFKFFYGATRQKWQISKVYTDVNQIYDFN